MNVKELELRLENHFKLFSNSESFEEIKEEKKE